MVTSLEAWALLGRAPGLTAEQARAAIGRAGGVERVGRLSPGLLADCGFGQAAIAAVAQPDRPALERDLAWLSRPGTALVPCDSTRYPARLAEVSGAPAVLYVLGDPTRLADPQLAIVGSRNPTPGGRRTAFAFARHLSGTGLTVTSGLALGIDAASHEGALAADGATIAVCGTGLDQVYPREHVDLAERIALRGALVSEFPPGTPPQKHHFPQRNRLISGLSLGVLVVEAARQSGSLVTARHAGEQGREVFAIPGSIHSPLSRGCHFLIRNGAKLVETADDILVELRLPLVNESLRSAAATPSGAGEGGPSLDKDYEILLNALAFEPAGIDELVARTGLPSESVASMLLILELQGRVEPHPGGRFGRLHEHRE